MIYIPSYQRDKVDTLKYLPKNLLKQTVIVVQKRDKERLQNLPDGVRKVVLPDEIRSIGPTRQWILDNAESPEIIMIDDDVTMSIRKAEFLYNLIGATHNHVEEHMENMRYLLRYYPLVGTSERKEGHLRYSGYVSEVGRHTRFHVINIPRVQELGVRYDRTNLIEDYDFILQILEAGVPNAVYHQLFTGDASTASPGGCLEMRKSIDLLRNMETFRDMHPEGVVKIVTKETKVGKEVFSRPDAVIGWKKAYEWGCKNALELNRLLQ